MNNLFVKYAIWILYIVVASSILFVILNFGKNEVWGLNPIAIGILGTSIPYLLAQFLKK